MDELKLQLQQLINEYVLKLQASEQKLQETEETLRILKKSFVVLEERLAPCFEEIQELKHKIKQYELSQNELTEQNLDLNNQLAQSIAALNKYKHKNSSKFYALILLVIICMVTLGLALSNNIIVAKVEKTFLKNEINNTQGTKLKYKRHKRASDNEAFSNDEAKTTKDGVEKSIDDNN